MVRSKAIIITRYTVEDRYITHYRAGHYYYCGMVVTKSGHNLRTQGFQMQLHIIIEY